MKHLLLAVAIAAAAAPAHANDFQPIFEEAFSLWAASSLRMDMCNSTSRTRGEIATILDDAATTFYPGWLDGSERAKFRDRMEFEGSKAQAKGRIEFQSEGCFQVEVLERVGRQTVDRALEGAKLFP